MTPSSFTGDNGILFRRIAEVARSGRLDRDPEWHSLLALWQKDRLDTSRRQRLIAKLRHLEVEEAFGRHPPFRKPQLEKQGVLVGYDVDGDEVRLPHDFAVEGALFVGNTGSGKSTFLLQVSRGIAAIGRKVWVSDMAKRQARHWRSSFREVGSDLVILPASDLHYNILQATGDPHRHLAMVVDLLDRRLGLPPRSRAVIRRKGYELYARFGIFDGHTDSWPTLFDLFEAVRVDRDINSQSRDALLDRLSAFLLALTPRCGAYRYAWRPIDLARHSIDFEMAGASEQVKHLVLESLLNSLFAHEIERGTLNSRLRLAIAFEDSMRFFDAGQQPGSELMPIEESAGVVRSTGLGFVAIVQSTVGLSRRMVPNLATKVMFRLGSSEDYQKVGRDIGMNAIQRDWAALHLGPGLAIVQASQGAWRHPALIRVPLVEPPAEVDEAEVADSQRPLQALRVEPAEEFARWTPVPQIQLASSEIPKQLDPGGTEKPGPNRAAPAGTRRSEKAMLSKDALDYIDSIAQDPTRSQTDRDKELGFSAWKANSIRTELIMNRIIEIIPVNPGGRGKRYLLARLTRHGREIAGRYGIKIATGFGRGHPKHQRYSNDVAELARASGCEARIEDQSLGARVDVLILTRDGRRLAVEVETHKGNELNNIKKDLEAGADQVISLVENKQRVETIKAKVAETIGADQASSVQVAHLSELSQIISNALVSVGRGQKQEQERTKARIPKNPRSQEDPTGSPENTHDQETKSPLNVTDWLEAVVIGGRVLAKKKGARRKPRRVPMGQEQLLRTVVAHGSASLEELCDAFKNEWESIQQRNPEENTPNKNRAFFRNRADTAARVNASLLAGYRSEEQEQLLKRTGWRFVGLACNYQQFAITVIACTELTELETKVVEASGRGRAQRQPSQHRD